MLPLYVMSQHVFARCCAAFDGSRPSCGSRIPTFHLPAVGKLEHGLRLLFLTLALGVVGHLLDLAFLVRLGLARSLRRIVQGALPQGCIASLNEPRGWWGAASRLLVASVELRVSAFELGAASPGREPASASSSSGPLAFSPATRAHQFPTQSGVSETCEDGSSVASRVPLRSSALRLLRRLGGF